MENVCLAVFSWVIWAPTGQTIREKAMVRLVPSNPVESCLFDQATETLPKSSRCEGEWMQWSRAFVSHCAAVNGVTNDPDVAPY